MYGDFYLNEDMFDFSECLDSLKIFDATNKKVVDKVKSKTRDIPFFGLLD